MSFYFILLFLEWGGGGVVLWLGICVKVAVEGISWICILSTPHPPPLSLSLSPSLKGGFLSLPRILYYKWQLFEINAPKAGFLIAHGTMLCDVGRGNYHWLHCEQ